MENTFAITAAENVSTEKKMAVVWCVFIPKQGVKMAKAVKCVDCVYYRSSSVSNKNCIHMCHFGLDNGYIRGILPEECYKKQNTGYISKKDSDKKNKMRAMKQKGFLNMPNVINKNIKKEAMEAVNSGSMTIIAASEKYGVGKSTLGRWLKEERDAAKEPEKEPKVVEQPAEKKAMEPEQLETTFVVDENCIKAAAYDVITSQMMLYPDSNTDAMICFVQGVQALAQRLCAEVLENG